MNATTAPLFDFGPEPTPAQEMLSSIVGLYMDSHGIDTAALREGQVSTPDVHRFVAFIDGVITTLETLDTPAQGPARGEARP